VTWVLGSGEVAISNQSRLTKLNHKELQQIKLSKPKYKTLFIIDAFYIYPPPFLLVAHDQQAINRRITMNKGRGTHQIVYTLT